MFPHHSTDLQVEITHHDMLQCTETDGEHKNCELVNMDINNAGLKILKIGCTNVLLGGKHI